MCQWLCNSHVTSKFTGLGTGTKETRTVHVVLCTKIGLLLHADVLANDMEIVSHETEA